MRAIIVEDELAGQRMLIELVKTYCSSVEILAAVPTVAEAVAVINAEQPDIVFLDIELPQENGMQLFNYFEKPSFKVIFTTSYNNYAVEAFRLAATDYLLKPISGQDLVRSVNRAIESSAESSNKSRTKLQMYFEKSIDRISIATLAGYDFYPLGDIIRAEAEGRYTTFYFRKGHKVISTKNIGEYEKLLIPKGFYRTHRSHLINLAFIQKYQKGNTPLIELEDGSIVPVAGKKKEDLVKIIKDLF